MAKRSGPKIQELSLDLIDEPKGILRMDIDPDDLGDLAQSISEIGLLQPILVAIDGARYEIVFGHRRYLACKKLGLSGIKSIIRTMTKQEIGVARATENIARADLTPIEEASTYKNLLDEYGLSLEQVARRMGKSPATIKRRMDLLKMPPVLQKATHKKQISMTVAEELWSIRDPASLEYYLMFAVENGCTREVARSWASDWRSSQRRQQNTNVESGGGDLSPMAPRPTYLPCDICSQPVELGKDTILRVCPGCNLTIKKSLEV